MGGQRLIGLAVAGLGSIVLARCLTPEIFGTYAILWFCIALAINASEMGLTAALMLQSEDRLRLELPAVATAQLLVMMALAAVMAVITPILIDWLGLGPDAIWPLRAMVVLLPLSAVRLVPAVKFERRLCYMPLTIADTIDTIVFYGVAVAAAYAGAGLWSFVIGLLVGRVVSISTLWLRERWWPVLPIPWDEWRSTIRRGWAFQSTAMLVQAREAVTPILVRFLAGVPAVGLLNLASALALQSVHMTNVATRVLFPAFARLRGDDAAFGSACERALNRVAVIIVPATAILCATADPFVRLVYGTRWSAATPAVQLFCLSALVGGLTMVAIHALNALGHASVVFRLNVWWTIQLWVLTPILMIPFGFVGFAVAHVIQGMGSTLAFHHLRRLRPIRVLAQLHAPCAAAAPVATGLYALGSWLTNLALLAGAVAVAAAVYLCLLTLMSGSSWRAEIWREWRHVVDTRWSHGLS